MMGKITKGGSFRGCVEYVTRKKTDNPDGTPCSEWRIIDLKDVSDLVGRESIIASFEVAYRSKSRHLYPDAQLRQPGPA